MITSPTTTRVEEHTDADINEEIYNRTKNNVFLYASAGPSAIDRRLRELEMEWDIERVLEANAASFCLMGLALGAFIDRRWFIFPGAVAGFLLQHAIQGWCPPVPLFRRMGIRTAHEIQQERHALKALRGDYRDVAEIKAEVNGADALQVTRAFEAAGNDSST
ncbi:MAG TPA: hypothetical protein VLA60_09565 [Nitrospirales bacterium]|nr:hypothetical protein [Nitrospirales bacterium]